MKRSFKNRFSTTLFSIVLMVGLFSCQTDLLEPANKINYLSDVVFDSPSRVDQQVRGLYDAMKNGNFLGGRYHIYNDIRAEEFINRLTNGVTGLQTWNHTLVESTNEVNNLWNAAYAGINQVNVFLAAIDENASKFVPPAFPADYATTTVPQFKAEARFLRGIAYYYLLQLYARPYIDGNGSKPGLPLRLTAERGPGQDNLARSTVAEVYTQILDDLNFAEQNLPLTNGSATLNNTRAHRNTAIAFKTRVYLTMHRWNDVITEANKIVSASAPFTATTGVAHALQSSFANVFAAPYTTSESIFSMPFAVLDPPGGQNQLGYYYLSSTLGGNGEYNLNPNGIIANAGWKASDARRSFVANVSGTRYLTKFSSPSPYTDSAPVIRYAEVLLNLAEARVRSTGTVDAQAIALLNAVRGRSDATTVFTAADFATSDDLINALLTERRIEFLGEGLRSIDLMRMNAVIPGKGSIAAVSPSDPNYVWPIPSGELVVNTLMTRN
jgi:hypothetical protein